MLARLSVEDRMFRKQFLGESKRNRETPLLDIKSKQSLNREDGRKQQFYITLTEWGSVRVCEIFIFFFRVWLPVGFDARRTSNQTIFLRPNTYYRRISCLRYDEQLAYASKLVIFTVSCMEYAKGNVENRIFHIEPAFLYAGNWCLE